MTGARKALKEAKKFGAVKTAGVNRRTASCKRVPTQDEITLTPGAAYVHMTSNETHSTATEFHYLPGVRRHAVLVCDTSSDMFSRPIDMSKYGLIYSGAQKNMGPSGVTVVIVREDLLARSVDALPTMMNYKVQADNGSLYNTPPVFGIYILRPRLRNG